MAQWPQNEPQKAESTTSAPANISQSQGTVVGTAPKPEDMKGVPAPNQTQPATDPTLKYFQRKPVLAAIKGLKCLIWAGPGAGKTFFAESAPEPIFIIDTEYGAEKVKMFNFPNKDVRVFEVAVINPVSGEVDFEQAINQVEAAIKTLKDIGKGTVVIDSISDIYTWFNMWVYRTAEKKVSATTGKEYIDRLSRQWQERNEKYYLMIMRLLSLPINVIATAKEVSIFDDHGKDTGRKEAKCMDNTEYWFDIVVRIIKAESSDSKTPAKYYGVVQKFRQMRTDLKIENITVPTLAKSFEDATKIKIELM